MASQSMGNDGQSSQTCSEASGGRGRCSAGKGFMLFGVRVMEGSFRKSASTNNLAQYEQAQDSNNDVTAGYASDDVVHPSDRSRHRKRGVAWSEEEHRLFLLGLQKVGKGDWRGISRNFVKTRTPTQVASHAQKYFLRRNNHNRRRRRSSLFDITTDAVLSSAMEDQMHLENLPHLPIIQKQQNPSKNLEKFPVSSFPMTVTPLMVPPITSEDSMENLTTVVQVNQLNNSPRPIKPIPILPIPPSSKLANLDLNKTTNLESPSLLLNLSTPSPPPSSLSMPLSPPSNQQSLPQLPPSNQQSPRGRHASTFQAMPPSFNGSGGDSIISVA